MGFKQESDYRSSVLLRQHQLLYVARPSGVGVTVVFAKNAPPHPYNLDTYDIRLRCYDGSGQELSPLPTQAQAQIGGRKRFETVDLRVAPESCTVESLTGTNAVKLFTAKPAAADLRAMTVFDKYKVTAIHDAVVVFDRTIEIRPATVSSPLTPDHYSNNQGRIVVSDIQIGAINDVFGVELYTAMATHLGVGIVDATGKEFFRYYPALKASVTNLVLLSPLGFDRNEQAALPFRSLNLYVYTPDTNAPVFTMRLGAIWSSSDRVALMARLQRHPSIFIPYDD